MQSRSNKKKEAPNVAIKIPAIKPQNKKDTTLYWIAVIVIVLVILFLQPTLVGGQIHVPCGGQGYMNVTTGECSCVNGFYGSDCQLRYCPFGTSWYADPKQNHKREMPLVECSNMGICNTMTGECVCRDGFDGRGCERMACPASGSDSVSFLQTASLATFPIADITVEGFIDLAQTTGGYSFPRSTATSNINLVPGSGVDSVSLRPCGGRGLCRSMREFAAMFDGVHSLRPPITYSNWDADKIHGCLCDSGWGGYGCDQRTCMFGRDPTDRSPAAALAKSEQWVVQCQADGGYFSIFILGSYTQPIPFDADPGYLQYALESLNTVGKVRVKMQAGDDGVPAICGTSSALSTSIWLLDYVGQMPPIQLFNATANTRMWPNGGTPLSLSTGTGVVLQMATTYTMVCPVCKDCSGSIYFKYGTSLSPPLSVLYHNSSNITAVYNAVNGLADFQASRWPGIRLSVNQYQTGLTTLTPMYSVCDKSVSVTTSITMTSSVGNIPSLELIDGTYYYANLTAAANISFISTGGKGKLFECSNQGFCDRVAGQCDCNALVQDGQLQYSATSSDGNGGPGNRADCGYLMLLPSATYCATHGNNACSGHGTCSNSTGGICQCFDGWYGMTCAVKHCPLGQAWFDEALTSTVAHQRVECSSMGTCDRSSGTCTCRWGFTGIACEVLDCPRDPTTTVPCSGNGRCMTLSSIARDLHGLAYGSSTNPGLLPTAWDGEQWSNCVCSAKVSAGYTPTGDPRYPLVGPRGVISGFDAQSVPLPGYTGYDCSQRNCPMGDTTSPRNPSGGQLAVQRVVCVGSNTTQANFTLGIFGQVTLPIFVGMGAAQIKAAIEYPETIGNVSISFPNVQYDGITSACHSLANSTTGGFLVTFLTEFGNLPLMTSAVGQTSTYHPLTITVSTFRQGTNSNSECGGPSMGTCNRATGLCTCASRHTSSNGTASGRGNVGDCAYFDPNPITT